MHAMPCVDVEEFQPFFSVTMATDYPTDDELILMTTIQLRNLLEQRVISQEQHRELRSRRRRLQNRKYARRCAKKKQTEVAELAAAAKNESSIIKVCAVFCCCE